jgi:hypothetical protein
MGPGSVDGEPCEIWIANNGDYNMSACIAADGVPREFNTTEDTFRFWNISVGALDDKVFEPSDACAHKNPSPTCANGDKASIDVYRAHSSLEPRSLENRNAGDALGDVTWACGLNYYDDYLVTHFAVQVNSSWGEYQDCHYQDGDNQCHGFFGKPVGRESAQARGKGKLQGQCSPNDDVGSWMSFPRDGKCPEGKSVGEGGCTWTAQVKSTVSLGCIVNRGLKESCASELGISPKTRSAAIFKAALDSADPSLGGCPDVSAPLLV